MSWTKMVDAKYNIETQCNYSYQRNSVLAVFDQSLCDLGQQMAVEFGEDYEDLYNPLFGIPDDDL